MPLGAGSAAAEAVKQTWNVVVVTYTGLLKLIERVVPLDSIGGPIMIAQMVSRCAGLGNARLPVPAVNLGVLNLLPIPVLDGGHLLFYAIEIIMRKPVSPRMRVLGPPRSDWPFSSASCCWPPSTTHPPPVEHHRYKPKICQYF